MMDQLIPFLKPNKKLRNEVMMDQLIPQTKHASVSFAPERYATGNVILHRVTISTAPIIKTCALSRKLGDEGR